MSNFPRLPEAPVAQSPGVLANGSIEMTIRFNSLHWRQQAAPSDGMEEADSATSGFRQQLVSLSLSQERTEDPPVTVSGDNNFLLDKPSVAGIIETESQFHYAVRILTWPPLKKNYSDSRASSPKTG